MRLSEANIKELESRGCSAQDWSRVHIADIDCSRFKSVRFSGDVTIATQSGVVSLGDGVDVRASISDVLLHNCTIAKDVYISNVRQYISNYCIGQGVVISGVDAISSPQGSTFGNGIKVSVLNEAGGREVMIFDNLSSQLAYIMALYRERTALVQALEQMIGRYTQDVSECGAYIGDGAVVKNCGEITSVRIGEGAIVDGALRLVDGSINSTIASPVYIGRGVIAEHFIISSDARVTGGVLLERCFVGQGSELGKQFSAENSLFFSNCVAMHGEACATFAGPYTVTHHKSTLLIGGMFSFMNAGSGSNQSNHMYKFGPVHQGIVERGCKLASGSYMLWPMRVGPFSLILADHYSNVDTSKFPFSYIIEKQYGKPVIIPAATLRNVGTIRDVGKWQSRDKRALNDRLDTINFKLLTPYTIERIAQGKQLLEKMVEEGDYNQTEYIYGFCKLRREYVERGIEYYGSAIEKFIGDQLLDRLLNSRWSTLEELRSVLMPSGDLGSGQWLDISGAICPRSEVDRIVNSISRFEYSSLDEVCQEFQSLEQNYGEYSWNWSIPLLEQRLAVELTALTPSVILNYLDDYLCAVRAINQGVLDDAVNEFSDLMRTGFGVDGDESVRDSDFREVRGEFQDNSFVQAVNAHSLTKANAVEELKCRLSRLM